MLKLLFIAVTALTAATAAAAAKAAMDTKKTDTAESVVAEERIIIPSERETAECLFIQEVRAMLKNKNPQKNTQSKKKSFIKFENRKG